MLHRVRADAVLLIGLSVVLLTWLGVRNDFPTAPPAPLPAFIGDVEGASIGVEYAADGPFWSIDTERARLMATNTRDEDATLDISFTVVDGPCGRGQSISVSGDVDAEITVPPGGSVEVQLGPIAVGPFGDVAIDARPSMPTCQPVGGDPRPIAFQIYRLGLDRSS